MNAQSDRCLTTVATAGGACRIARRAASCNPVTGSGSGCGARAALNRAKQRTADARLSLEPRSRAPRNARLFFVSRKAQPRGDSEPQSAHEATEDVFGTGAERDYRLDIGRRARAQRAGDP